MEDVLERLVRHRKRVKRYPWTSAVMPKRV